MRSNEPTRRLSTRRSPLFVVLALSLVACSGRKREIDAYAAETCACTTFDCTLDVQEKYEATLVRPSSWLERHFTSAAATAAMIDAMKRADACQRKLEPPKVKCGGPQKLSCPSGLRCVVDPSVADAEGVCAPLPKNDVIDE